MKKSYEILPGMNAASLDAAIQKYGLPSPSARSVKGHGGIPIADFGNPAGGTGSHQHSPTASGIPTHGYGKQLKSYEILPPPGVATRGIKGCGGGCGCGGKCGGGGKGYEILPPGMKKSGGCGPGKAGGCGCGGKCGGSGGGILLPKTGIMLPPSTEFLRPLRLPPYGGPPPGSYKALGGPLSPGKLADPTDGLELRLPPLSPPSCADIRAQISAIVDRIRFLETTHPPPEVCGRCSDPDISAAECVYRNCVMLSYIPEARDALIECECIKRNLMFPATKYHCTDPRYVRSTRFSDENQRFIDELCNPGPAVSELLDQLNTWLDQLRRQRCEERPPREDFCRTHPDHPLCHPPPFDLSRCQFPPLDPRCWGLVLPPFGTPGVRPPVPPFSDPGNWRCNSLLREFSDRRQDFFDTGNVHNMLVRLAESLSQPVPLPPPEGCFVSPACAELVRLRTSLRTSLGNVPDIADYEEHYPINRARRAVQAVIGDLDRILLDCAINAVGGEGALPLVCSPGYNARIWARAVDSVASQRGNSYTAVLDAMERANQQLQVDSKSLFRYRCRTPPYLTAPPY